jgi:hypothetical protein
MRTFILIRDEDVSGISGTGAVAEGVEFGDGGVVVRWFKRPGAAPEPTTVIHPNLENVMVLHSHDGKTRLEWV